MKTKQAKEESDKSIDEDAAVEPKTRGQKKASDTNDDEKNNPATEEPKTSKQIKRPVGRPKAVTTKKKPLGIRKVLRSRKAAQITKEKVKKAVKQKVTRAKKAAIKTEPEEPEDKGPDLLIPPSEIKKEPIDETTPTSRSSSPKTAGRRQRLSSDIIMMKSLLADAPNNLIVGPRTSPYSMRKERSNSPSLFEGKSLRSGSSRKQKKNLLNEVVMNEQKKRRRLLSDSKTAEGTESTEDCKKLKRGRSSSRDGSEISKCSDITESDISLSEALNDTDIKDFNKKLDKPKTDLDVDIENNVQISPIEKVPSLNVDIKLAETKTDPSSNTNEKNKKKLSLKRSTSLDSDNNNSNRLKLDNLNTSDVEDKSLVKTENDTLFEARSTILTSMSKTINSKQLSKNIRKARRGRKAATTPKMSVGAATKSAISTVTSDATEDKQETLESLSKDINDLINDLDQNLNHPEVTNNSGAVENADQTQTKTIPKSYSSKPLGDNNSIVTPDTPVKDKDGAVTNENTPSKADDSENIRLHYEEDSMDKTDGKQERTYKCSTVASIDLLMDRLKEFEEFDKRRQRQESESKSIESKPVMVTNDVVLIPKSGDIKPLKDIQTLRSPEKPIEKENLLSCFENNSAISIVKRDPGPRRSVDIDLPNSVTLIKRNSITARKESTSSNHSRETDAISIFEKSLGRDVTLTEIRKSVEKPPSTPTSSTQLDLHQFATIQPTSSSHSLVLIDSNQISITPRNIIEPKMGVDFQLTKHPLRASREPLSRKSSESGNDNEERMATIERIMSAAHQVQSPAISITPAPVAVKSPESQPMDTEALEPPIENVKEIPKDITMASEVPKVLDTSQKSEVVKEETAKTDIDDQIKKVDEVKTEPEKVTEAIKSVERSTVITEENSDKMEIDSILETKSDIMDKPKNKEKITPEVEEKSGEPESIRGRASSEEVTKSKVEAIPGVSESIRGRNSSEELTKPEVEAEPEVPKSRCRTLSEEKTKAEVPKSARCKNSTEEKTKPEIEAKLEVPKSTRARISTEEKAKLEIEAKPVVPKSTRGRNSSEEKAKLEIEAKTELAKSTRSKTASEEKTKPEIEGKPEVSKSIRSRNSSEDKAKLEIEAKLEVAESVRGKNSSGDKAKLEMEAKPEVAKPTRDKILPEEKTKPEIEVENEVYKSIRCRTSSEEKPKLEVETKPEVPKSTRGRTSTEEKTKSEVEAKPEVSKSTRGRNSAEGKAKLEIVAKPEVDKSARSRTSSEEKTKPETETKPEVTKPTRGRTSTEETTKPEGEAKPEIFKSTKGRISSEEKTKPVIEGKPEIPKSTRASKLSRNSMESQPGPSNVLHETPESQKRKENVLRTLGLLTHKAAKEAKIEKMKEKERIYSGLMNNKNKVAKSGDYTGTLKTVIKLNRGVGDREKKKYRSSLKMTFQKSKHRGRPPLEDGADGQDETFYTIERREGGAGATFDGGHRKSHYSNRLNHEAEAVPEPAEPKEILKLVIPEKASSFSIHPGRLCQDQCFYCGGKFGLFDTPCHIAQMKSADRQKKVLDNEEKLTIDSCLCDACYRHVDRRANCPSYRKRPPGPFKQATAPQPLDSSLNKASSSSDKPPSPVIEEESEPDSPPTAAAPPARSAVCHTEGCSTIAECSIRRKWLIKMRASVNKILQLQGDYPGLHTIPLCAAHHRLLAPLTTCALCRRRHRHHNLHQLATYEEVNPLIAAAGIPVQFSERPILCKMCRYYCSLLTRPAHNDRFKHTFRVKLLQIYNIEIPPEPEPEQEVDVNQTEDPNRQKKKVSPSKHKSKQRKLDDQKPESESSDKTESSPEKMQEDVQILHPLEEDIESLISSNKILVPGAKSQEMTQQSDGSENDHVMEFEPLLPIDKQTELQYLLQKQNNPAQFLHQNVNLTQKHKTTNKLQNASSIQKPGLQHRIHDKNAKRIQNLGQIITHKDKPSSDSETSDPEKSKEPVVFKNISLNDECTIESITNKKPADINTLKNKWQMSESFSQVKKNLSELSKKFTVEKEPKKTSECKYSNPVKRLETNPSISVRELFPGEEEMNLQCNIEFNSVKGVTPEGWEKCSSQIQYDVETKRLWTELQRPYGNQSSFLRHLILLEKYFRSGDLVLSHNASPHAANYSDSVQSRLRAYDNVVNDTPRRSEPAINLIEYRKPKHSANGKSLLKTSHSEDKDGKKFMPPPGILPKKKTDKSKSKPLPPELIAINTPNNQGRKAIQNVLHNIQQLVKGVSASDPTEVAAAPVPVAPLVPIAPAPSVAKSEPPKEKREEKPKEAKSKKPTSKPWRPTLMPITPENVLKTASEPTQVAVDGRHLPSLVQVMSSGKRYHITIQDYNKMCIMRREKLQQLEGEKAKKQDDSNTSTVVTEIQTSAMLGNGGTVMQNIPNPKEDKTKEMPELSQISTNAATILKNVGLKNITIAPIPQKTATITSQTVSSPISTSPSLFMTSTPIKLPHLGPAVSITSETILTPNFPNLPIMSSTMVMPKIPKSLTVIPQTIVSSIPQNVIPQNVIVPQTMVVPTSMMLQQPVATSAQIVAENSRP